MQTIYKKSFLFLFFLVFSFSLSACTKEVVEEPVVSEPPASVEDEKVVDTKPNDNEDTNFSLSQDKDGWSTFKSQSCGFEIRFPEDWKFSSHCNKEGSINTLLNLTNNDDVRGYGYDGVIWMSVVKARYYDDLSEYIVGEVIESSGGKWGKSITKTEKFDYINDTAIIINKEYFSPIEGTPGIKKSVFFNQNKNTYLISAQIPYNNKDLNKLFEEIAKTIKITE